MQDALVGGRSNLSRTQVNLARTLTCANLCISNDLLPQCLSNWKSIMIHPCPSNIVKQTFGFFQCFPPSFPFGYFPSHWFFAKTLWKAHLVDGVLKASTPIGRIGHSIDLQPVPQANGKYSTGDNGYMANMTCLKCKDFDVQITSNTVKWNSKEECADMSQHGSH